jgi:pyridoxal phosphate enzyme (YggS family)
MSSSAEEMTKNLGEVRERIERAASRAGRKAEEITLVAVSKTHSAAQIQELYDTGVKHFGENRVQEWESKRGALANFDATLHMIGHLQSNKVARAVRSFNTVDSVDTVALLERLDRAKKDFNTEGTEFTEKREELAARMRLERLRVLIEVKLDPRPAKTGASEDELQLLVESALRFPHLELTGLMGVPPYFEDAEKARPYFRRLRELRDSIRAQLRKDILPVLSMGMSHDFEVAIEEGATEIRVGTALFGERKRE